MDKLIVKVTKTLQKYRMIQCGDKIIVAVSGGPDSICLIDILNQLKKPFGLSLLIAHVNHGIRKREAEIEARFVRLKSFHMGIPFEQLSVSVPSFAEEEGLSIEQAGRRLRYRFFKDLSLKYHAHKIALGHQADDQVETILMRMIRGSGLQGVRGIPAVRGEFIRPLIECRRREIENYCLRRNISYCIDSSNREPMYLRNQIRNQLIPLLVKQYNSSFCDHLLQLQEIVQGELTFLEEITEQYYSESIIQKSSAHMVLDSKKLREWPVALQRRVIRKALRHLSDYLADIQFRHVEDIRNLCLMNHGEKVLDLPGKIQIRKSYQNLEIITAQGDQESLNRKKLIQWEYPLQIDKEQEYAQLGKMINTKKCCIKPSTLKNCLKNTANKQAVLDYEKLALPLKIRNRRPGDRFVPLNSCFFKKIKTYFIDQKVPRHDRENIALVVDHLNRIVWIVGYQIDDRFKITENTRKILVIEQNDMKIGS